MAPTDFKISLSAKTFEDDTLMNLRGEDLKMQGVLHHLLPVYFSSATPE